MIGNNNDNIKQNNSKFNSKREDFSKFEANDKENRSPRDDKFGNTGVIENRGKFSQGTPYVQNIDHNSSVKFNFMTDSTRNNSDYSRTVQRMDSVRENINNWSFSGVRNTNNIFNNFINNSNINNSNNVNSSNPFLSFNAQNFNSTIQNNQNYQNNLIRSSYFSTSLLKDEAVKNENKFNSNNNSLNKFKENASSNFPNNHTLIQSNKKPNFDLNESKRYFKDLSKMSLKSSLSNVTWNNNQTNFNFNLNNVNTNNPFLPYTNMINQNLLSTPNSIFSSNTRNSFINYSNNNNNNIFQSKINSNISINSFSNYNSPWSSISSINRNSNFAGSNIFSLNSNNNINLFSNQSHNLSYGSLNFNTSNMVSNFNSDSFNSTNHTVFPNFMRSVNNSNSGNFSNINSNISSFSNFYNFNNNHNNNESTTNNFNQIVEIENENDESPNQSNKSENLNSAIQEEEEQKIKEHEKKLLIPKEKTNDEIYKLLKINKFVRKPEIPANKSTRRISDYKRLDTDDIDETYDYNNLCKKKKIHSVKKNFASEVKMENSNTGVIKKFNIFRDREIGINFYWQRHTISFEEDEDIETDDDQITIADFHVINELGEAIKIFNSRGADILTNKMIFKNRENVLEK